jgi:hypothetical protein
MYKIEQRHNRGWLQFVITGLNQQAAGDCES